MAQDRKKKKIKKLVVYRFAASFQLKANVIKDCVCLCRDCFPEWGDFSCKTWPKESFMPKRKCLIFTTENQNIWFF